ncbi:hypothetical protein [Prescottella subtropica]|uniref:hypothetical protein n=1 Tax=Prescottella subtropica TaxID=2545757 RepID=UPI0010F9A95E|nr:hypothetical protein [Prescottella subtropica]
MFVTRKALRQKLLQAAVLAKIDREGLRIDTDPIRGNLRTIRRHVSDEPLMRSYLAWWERIVDGNDIEELRAVVARDDEAGAEMRNLSPLSMLLTEDERRQFLGEFSARWATRSRHPPA